MNRLDWIIIVAAVGYGIGGFRNGAVVGLFSLVGFFGGAVARCPAGPTARLAAGRRAGAGAGRDRVRADRRDGRAAARPCGAPGMLRRRVTWRQAQAFDCRRRSALGVLSVLLVAWMVAVPLASSPYPSLSSAVQPVDDRARRRRRDADAVRDVYASLRRFLDRSGFPPVFGDLPSTRIVDVGAARP